mgnify:CR=1 FL=1
MAAFIEPVFVQRILDARVVTTAENRLQKVVINFVENANGPYIVATRNFTGNVLGQQYEGVEQRERDLNDQRNNIFTLADELKTFIRNAAFQHEPRLPRRTRMMGTLLIYAAATSSSRSLRNIDANNLTFNQIFTLFQDMVQSNDNLVITDLTFTFFYYRTGLLIGAGAITPPSWWKDKQRLLWKTYEDDDGPINCAALSLAFGMLTPTRRTNVNRDVHMLKREARLIQNNLGNFIYRLGRTSCN